MDLDALSGAALGAALVVAALVEYLFPPFPGDTMAVMGGALAARAGDPLLLAVLALTLGSLGGMALTWRVGAALHGRLEHRADTERIFGLEVALLKRAALRVRAQGTWLLLVNRFVPSFRAVLFVAAGAAGLPLGRVLALGGLSALAWNSLLVAVGVTLGSNVGRIELWLAKYRFIAGTVVAVGVAAWLAWRLLRRRAR